MGALLPFFLGPVITGSGIALWARGPGEEAGGGGAPHPGGLGGGGGLVKPTFGGGGGPRGRGGITRGVVGPRPPKFTAESWEWSEDEEEWFPAKGKESGTGREREKSAGRSPVRTTPGEGRGQGGSRWRALPEIGRTSGRERGVGSGEEKEAALGVNY